MVEYTEAAVRRFELAKEIIDIIQKKTNRTNEEWHAYTLKLDKYSPDPFIFEVYTLETVKVFGKKIKRLGQASKKLLFSIEIINKKKTIIVHNEALIEFAPGDKIPITFGDENWVLEFK